MLLTKYYLVYSGLHIKSAVDGKNAKRNAVALLFLVIWLLYELQCCVFKISTRILDEVFLKY